MHLFNAAVNETRAIVYGQNNNIFQANSYLHLSIKVLHAFCQKAVKFEVFPRIP